MKPIIKVEELSKRYRMGRRAAAHPTLRDSLAATFRRPLRLRQSGGAGAAEEWVWALRDVAFEVYPGDTIGIIGHNGAGKSTLLKVLSRITEPTRGCVELYGRVGSLLEVGTGFHPELTGRENVFLNGAILGMNRLEIKRRFDEIVAFAELERFIDTPVKHYSSGMYMRLGFSVAAHLEPEILIVDEVLAVGDGAFQAKCLNRMRDLAGQGRTVLFVSHSMAAVEKLCRRGVVLDHGRVRYVGTQSEAIAQYLAGFATRAGSLRERVDRVGSGDVRLVGIAVRDGAGEQLPAVASGQDLEIHLYYEARPGFSRSGINAGVIVTTQFGAPVFLQHNRLTGDEFGSLPARGAFVCRLQRLPLPPAVYRIGCSLLVDGEYLDMVDDAGELRVVAGDFFGSGEVPPLTHGCCLVAAKWSLDAHATPPSDDDDSGAAATVTATATTAAEPAVGER